MKTILGRPEILAALLAAAAFLAGCRSTSVATTVDSGNAHLAFADRTVDVLGGCTEVDVNNGDATIVCAGHRVEISDRRLSIDGRGRTLPPYRPLIVACERGVVKVGIDGEPPQPW